MDQSYIRLVRDSFMNNTEVKYVANTNAYYGQAFMDFIINTKLANVMCSSSEVCYDEFEVVENILYPTLCSYNLYSPLMCVRIYMKMRNTINPIWLKLNQQKSIEEELKIWLALDDRHFSK